MTKIDQPTIDLRILRLKNLIEQRDLAWNRNDLTAAAKLQRDVDAARANGFGPLRGMPCTMHIGSDRYAAKVTEVTRTAHRVTVQINGRDDWTLTFSRRRDGRYVEVGHQHTYLGFLEAETRLDQEF